MTEHPFAARVHRDLVVVRGPDATSFLQSLVSQDLDAISTGAAAPCLLLQPQGKLLVAFDLHHRDSDEWWCVCEGGLGQVLADGLNRFKIRVKVEVESRAVEALALRGGSPHVSDPDAVAIPVAWNGAAACDVIGTRDAIDRIAVSFADALGDEVSYERARIEAGIPKMGVDIDDRTIPQEAELERLAVSFTKGCFVGQELVCRIDTRGHVNRHLRRLRATDGAFEPGAELTVDGQLVGTVTSSVGDVALGFVRREVQIGTPIETSGARGVVEATNPG